MKRSAGERERLPARRGERLPDVLLRRGRTLARHDQHGARQVRPRAGHRGADARNAAVAAGLPRRSSRPPFLPPRPGLRGGATACAPPPRGVTPPPPPPPASRARLPADYVPP